MDRIRPLLVGRIPAGFDPVAWARLAALCEVRRLEEVTATTWAASPVVLITWSALPGLAERGLPGHPRLVVITADVDPRGVCGLADHRPLTVVHPDQVSALDDRRRDTQVTAPT